MMKKPWKKIFAVLLSLALAVSLPLPLAAAAKAYVDIDVTDQNADDLTATVTLGMSGATAGHQVTLLVVKKGDDPADEEKILYIDQAPFASPFAHRIKLPAGADGAATYTLYVGGSGMPAPAEKDFSFKTAVPDLKEITRFAIAGQMAEAAIANSGSDAGTITVVMPLGTDLTKLTPSVSYHGKSLDPKSGVETDFSNPPVDYTVTALDDSTRTYKVTVLTSAPVFGHIDVLPAYTSAAASPSGELAFAAQAVNILGSGSQGLKWFLNGVEQEGFRDKDRFTVTTELQTSPTETAKPVPGENEVRVEAAGQRGTLIATAHFDIYEVSGAAKDFSFNILSNSLTVFTAKTARTAVLPIRFVQGATNGPLPPAGADTEVKLYTNYTKASKKEVANYTAELTSYNTVTITAADPNPASGKEVAKNTKNVTVEINGVAAARTFNLALNSKTPKITVTATPLDAAARGTYSRLVATAADGAPVVVEEVRLASNSAAGSIVVGKDRVGIDGNWKKNSVVAWAIVSSPDYASLPTPRGVPGEPLAPNQTAVKVTVKVANALNAPNPPRATTAGNTVAAKGRIDVTNLGAGIIVVPQAQHTIKGAKLLSASGGAEVLENVSEKFDIKVAEDGKSFTIRGVEGKAVPGVTDKVFLQLVLADDSLLNIPKALSIKPVRSATRAYQSTKAVTLNTARANLGGDVSLRFTSPIMAELGYVNLQAASMKGYKWNNVDDFDATDAATYPLELLAKGDADDMQTYTLRFKDGKAPTALSNGRKLPNSVTVKLELWPVGTYQLKANGQPDLDATGRPKPLMRGTKAATAPTVISVKVNIQQPLS